jgi:hypothetical protein
MTPNETGTPQITPHDPEHVGSRRDPEERPTAGRNEVREKNLDKTLADSFPTSDPPSSIPDPVSDHGSTQPSARSISDELIAGLPPGSWAAISDQERRVVGVGPTREEAVQSASGYQQSQIRIIRVPQDPDAPEQAA